jgi:predicted enzyme related to lactoylglutathione lyase
MIEHGSTLVVWIGVTDLEKASDFYAETLGLQVALLDHQAGWAEFVHPHCGAHLALQEVDPEELMPSGGATVIFDVPDIEKTMQQLEKSGVPFLTGVIALNGHRLATFVDPDGNHLQLRDLTPTEKPV